MTPFDILLLVCAVVLSLTALAVVVRMIVGPTILDRAVAIDSLVVLAVLGMALYAASAEAPWAGPAMLGLTGLAFIGTVTFARFVGREEPAPGRRRRLGQSETTTGPMESIHFQHLDPSRGVAPVEPVNAVEEDLTASQDSAHGFGAEDGSRGFEDEDPEHGVGAADDWRGTEDDRFEDEQDDGELGFGATDATGGRR
ncbi:monovalent cation/H+ antiporter complex subunit F [Brachybacterium sacelli]|uniref:Multicomponent Na+:H+ antiporter subunit F n=1 Tax=Brachybacterium sacelli TaxID=173364 RepID=A0ABS4X3J5_9MICO|nr:monovalent cation/H+ antiporter complex subunit F [Brachybacterium sacelli]MBP2383038.1 multicomponent Na+:H+ antiporter subunit F [Brachybacterium sacelli]